LILLLITNGKSARCITPVSVEVNSNNDIGKTYRINDRVPTMIMDVVWSQCLVGLCKSCCQIFLELQRIAGRKVSASKVQVKNMDTVRLMFATAEKFGKPVKN